MLLRLVKFTCYVLFGYSCVFLSVAVIFSKMAQCVPSAECPTQSCNRNENIEWANAGGVFFFFFSSFIMIIVVDERETMRL